MLSGARPLVVVALVGNGLPKSMQKPRTVMVAVPPAGTVTDHGSPGLARLLAPVRAGPATMPTTRASPNMSVAIRPDGLRQNDVVLECILSPFSSVCP